MNKDKKKVTAPQSNFPCDVSADQKKNYSGLCNGISWELYYHMIFSMRKKELYYGKKIFTIKGCIRYPFTKHNKHRQHMYNMITDTKVFYINKKGLICQSFKNLKDGNVRHVVYSIIRGNNRNIH